MPPFQTVGLRNNSSLNRGIGCAKVDYAVFVLFQHWANQSGPEKRLLSRRIRLMFVGVSLRSRFPLLDDQVTELFIQEVTLTGRLWEDRRRVLLG